MEKEVPKELRNFIDSARNKQNGKAVSFNTEYFV